jgi:NADH-quinone oxidoreductase subunit G
MRLPSPRPRLRLIATRKLYDLGTLVQHSPSLASMTVPNRLRVNPHDFDRLGVDDGAPVEVSSPRATTTMEVVADASVPRGTAALFVNQPGANPADLIDVSQPVTDIRVEVR